MAHNIKQLSPIEVDNLITLRAGEHKLGQNITLLPDDSVFDIATLQALKNTDDIQFALLGVPEDIGIRANSGRAGAASAWQTFLKYFLNTQSNDSLNVRRVLLLGSADIDRLQEQASEIDPQAKEYLTKLRSLCASVDEIVAPIVETLVCAGIEPILIGGGHNNAFPLLKGTSLAYRERKMVSTLGCINCDPHADYRALEGRHSGNGFSYAAHEGYLTQYYVAGLRESYNSHKLFADLKDAGHSFSTYEDIYIRRDLSWIEAIDRGIRLLSTDFIPVGLELDLDSIRCLPVSAESPLGISLEDANFFIHRAASKLPCAYLHLPEGAPHLWDNAVLGERYIGQTLSSLVTTYLKARSANTSISI